MLFRKAKEAQNIVQKGNNFLMEIKVVSDQEPFKIGWEDTDSDTEFGVIIMYLDIIYIIQHAVCQS